MKCGICGREKAEVVVDREGDPTLFFSLYFVCEECDAVVVEREDAR